MLIKDVVEVSSNEEFKEKALSYWTSVRSDMNGKKINKNCNISIEYFRNAWRTD